MSVDILLPIMAVGAVLFVSEMLARGKKARERLAERMDMTVLPTLEQNWNRYQAVESSGDAGIHCVFLIKMILIGIWG